MGRNSYFQFKRFRVVQEKAAMKVGTDGVLLGAWVKIDSPKRILDIGAGTGVISLMMAQRTKALITGIEIEENAADEAKKNVENSEWVDRIFIENISLQEYVKKDNGKFDFIISNPPFFCNCRKSVSQKLAIAKHNDFLPINDLVKGVKKILEPKGKLAIILPVYDAEIFIKEAKKHGLFLTRKTNVRPNSKKKFHRCLMEFCKVKTKLIINSVAINSDDGRDYTEEYKEITKDYYLNF